MSDAVTGVKYAIYLAPRPRDRTLPAGLSPALSWVANKAVLYRKAVHVCCISVSGDILPLKLSKLKFVPANLA